jgi:IS30 family transposase
MKQETAFTYLSNAERDEIQILHEKGYSCRKIARTLGRSPNTISYELKRVPSGYKATLGKQYARTKLKNRRLQWRKLNENKELRNYVVAGLKNSWNPDEIAGRMNRENSPWYVSKSAIYEWLETTRGEKYKKYLYSERPGRRHKKTGKQGQLLNIISISERPEALNKRE